MSVKWDRDEFYEMAMKPEFPDRMRFVVSRPEDAPLEATFSMEGIDNTVEQIKAFILARIMGHWQKDGQAPHEMAVNISLDLKAPSRRDLDQGSWPFWTFVDEGSVPLDGQHRRKDRRKE